MLGAAMKRRGRWLPLVEPPMGNGEDEMAAHLQDAIPLGQHGPVIVDMLQAVATEHCILTLIPERKVQPVIARIIQSHPDGLRYDRLRSGVPSPVADVDHMWAGQVARDKAAFALLPVGLAN